MRVMQNEIKRKTVKVARLTDEYMKTEPTRRISRKTGLATSNT